MHNFLFGVTISVGSENHSRAGSWADLGHFVSGNSKRRKCKACWELVDDDSDLGDPTWS